MTLTKKMFSSPTSEWDFTLLSRHPKSDTSGMFWVSTWPLFSTPMTTLWLYPWNPGTVDTFWLCRSSIQSWSLSEWSWKWTTRRLWISSAGHGLKPTSLKVSWTAFLVWDHFFRSKIRFWNNEKRSATTNARLKKKENQENLQKKNNLIRFYQKYSIYH